MTNTNKNIKLPKGWVEKEFGNVFDFLKTTSVSRENLTYNHNEDIIYNIHYGDIHATYSNEILDFDVEDKIPVLIDNNTAGNNFDYLKDGDLIIADASEDHEGIAECIEIKNIRNRKAIGGLHTFVARDVTGDTVDGYRCYIFKNPNIKLTLKKIATGISVYGVSKTNLKKLLIPLPPLLEQKKIAEILSTWDKAISNYELLITNYELRKKALMQKLLTGKVRFKEFEGQEWKEVKFTDYIELRHGYQFRDYDFTESGVPIIKIGNLIDSAGVSFKNITYINHNRISEFTNIILKKGDVLMALTGATLGKVSIVDTDQECLQNYRVGYFYPKNIDKIDNNYISLLLKSEKIQARIKHLINEAAQPNVGKADFKAIKVLVPRIEEQRKIASVLTVQYKQIDLLKKQKNALEQQKKGLMQKLLTGETRVKV